MKATHHSGPTWERIVAAVRVQGNPCWICGAFIDYSDSADRMRDSWSYTVDLALPKSCGGEYSLDNARACHRFCNLSRGNSMDLQPAREKAQRRKDWPGNATRPDNRWIIGDDFRT